MQPIPEVVVPAGWADGRGPLHRLLAAAIEDLIARGELPPGALLPTERGLAAQVGVSRATAAGAYRILKRSGRVDSRQGRGTWVAGAAPGRASTAEGIAPVLVHPGDVIDLSLAASAPDGLLRSALADAARRAAGRIQGVGYEPSGPEALRDRVSPGRPERVLVTTGAQQAIALLVDELVAPGDVVVVEDVTYVGALDAARRAGARLIAVPTGPEGVDVAALVDAVGRHRPALVYLNPTHQSPWGSVLDDAGRAEIVAFAARTGTVVVDDRTLAELAFDPARRPRPLASFDPAAPVATVGSLSKAVWPGLRVGWVEAAPELVAALASRRMVDDLGGSVLSTSVALEIWDDCPRWTARRAAELAAAHAHLVARLARELPKWEVAPASGGTGAWVRLPGADATLLARAAAERGVHVVAGPTLSAHGHATDRVRLAVTAPVPVLDVAVDRLVAAWRSTSAPAVAPRSPLV